MAQFQAKSKIQHISSMMWAHVSAPNALDSTSIIVQTIQKEFAKAGLDVPDAKAQFGDMGQALDRAGLVMGRHGDQFQPRLFPGIQPFGDR